MHKVDVLLLHIFAVQKTGGRKNNLARFGLFLHHLFGNVLGERHIGKRILIGLVNKPYRVPALRIFAHKVLHGRTRWLLLGSAPVAK